MLKKIIIVMLVVAVGVSLYVYKEYNRKPADVSAIKPAAALAADSLLNQYESDELKSNQLYLGKTIQVRGAISDIVQQADTLANVIIGNAGSLHKISCLLDKQHISLIQKYKTGQQITVKGICTGFLMDVELNRCVIVE